MTPKAPCTNPEGPPWHISAVNQCRLAVAGVVIMVSCSSEPGHPEMIRMGGVGGAGGADVAHAEVLPDGSIFRGATAEAEVAVVNKMPDDPSQISLVLPRVNGIVPTLVSAEEFPYPYKVIEEADQTVVTLYLPRGNEMGVSITPEAGQTVNLTIDPRAKLGTACIDFEMADAVIRFAEGAQHDVGPGETIFQPEESTEEYIDGSLRRVFHGLYHAEKDEIIRVSTENKIIIYSFLNGYPSRHEGVFELQLKAGQTLGLYPEVEENSGTSISIEQMKDDGICE